MVENFLELLHDNNPEIQESPQMVKKIFLKEREEVRERRKEGRKEGREGGRERGKKGGANHT